MFCNNPYFLIFSSSLFSLSTPKEPRPTSSLGGYALTTKDGKISYYKVSEGADSAVPFSSGINPNPVIVTNDSLEIGKTYSFGAYANGAFPSTYAYTLNGCDVIVAKDCLESAGYYASYFIVKATSNTITTSAFYFTNGGQFTQLD